MPINNTINDGDVVHGSQPLTIDGVPYETSNLKFDQQTTNFLRLSSKGIATGEVDILQRKGTGTATLHYSASTTIPPVFGGAFTVTPNPGVGSPIAYACTVKKVGLPFSAGAEAMVDIEFKINIGTVVLSVAT